MKRLGFVILVVVGVIVLIAGTAGTVFYLKVYRPIGSPLMAIGGGSTLEKQRLQNRAGFQPPVSGEVTAEQTAGFVAVEEAVQKRLADGIAVLARKQADLEGANEADAPSVQDTLAAFGDIKSLYLGAKRAQIDAMNQARFSKEEFEWVRRQLYHAAGLRLSLLDVSQILSGARDAVVEVRRFEPGGPVPAQNERLARPIAPLLRAWLALGFFGL
jgi:hypothetical protein